MTQIDFFASTVRGLFLAPGGLDRNCRDVPLLEDPILREGVAVADVLTAPPGCTVDKLEVLEALPGSIDAWQTREVALEEGMRIVVPLGGRFANRSIRGRAPDRPVSPGTVLDLLNVGGVTGLCDESRRPLVKLQVLGSVAQEDRPVLFSGLSTIPLESGLLENSPTPKTPIVLVTGTDMEVGKTTCAASLAFSLRVAGVHNTYAKATGTGRMRDLMRVSYGRPLGFFDSRRTSWDFVDVGLATTADIPAAKLRKRVRSLLRYAAARGEILVVEIADGPFFDGSLHVAADPWLQDWLRERGLIICACDTVGSTMIVHWLRSHMDLDEDAILISGRVANDPSLRREAERMSGVSAVNCASPGGFSPLGGKTAGGALADWVLRHFMARRRVSA